MSHKDNRDLRNLGQGGWCYTEHELFSVFLPLIGADGGMVYMAMTRLVPLAGARAEFPVTVDAVASESCVSRSTTHRKIRELVALGMVIETRHSKQRPSTYELPQLRELAKLGNEELRRRLETVSGVPRGDTDSRSDRPGVNRESARKAPQRLSGRVDSIQASAAVVEEEAKAPESPPELGVPRWDTGENDERNEASETPVSQKQGLVSQKQPPVSQGGIAFNSLRDKEKDSKNTPLPPKGGEGEGSPDREDGRGPILPWADLHRGQTGYAQSLPIAARWVLAECGISITRRLETMLVGQLNLTCDETTHTLDATAASMVARWREYLDLCGRQELRIQWGVVQFFGEGLWARPATWPRNTGTRSAQSGMATPRDPEAEKRAEAAWRESHAAHIQACAAQLEAMGHAEFARRMEPLADAALQGAALDELDEELVAIEDALHEHLLSAEPELATEARAKGEIYAKAYAGRMTREQLESLTQQMSRRRMWEVKALPRLSFFYMDPRTSVPRPSGT